MRNRLVVLVTTLAFVVVMAGTALAHPVAGPVCDDATKPGHSEYAQNHIAHAAQEGGIIGHAHKPGKAHRGWAGFCGVHSD